jgi:hypothetical protein
VRAASAGDLRAFERLIEAMKRTTTSVALAILRDVRASEDVAQEVYLRRIMARRRELERARDPGAEGRRERNYRLASLAGVVLGALGLAYGVYVVFTSG